MPEQQSQQRKAEDFRALHEGEPFVIPNPWDAGSAKVLAALGFKALATTSAGFAFTLGRLDGDVTLDEVMDHTAVLARATDLPVSVDMENGYGPAPEDAARAITRAAEAGAVGGSIEDYDPEGGIYDLNHATERVAAAAEAAAQRRLSIHLHGARREPLPRHPGPRRHDRPSAGLRPCRRRCAVRAVAAHGRGDPRRLRRDVQAGQRARHPRHDGARDRRRGRPPHQRRQPAHLGRRGAMAKAAEEMRDAGDFAALNVRVPLKEWLGSSRSPGA